MRHYFIWKTISCSRGNESARLGEIQCTLIELGWISVKWDENVPYESKFIELAQLTSQGSEMNFFPYQTKLIFIPLGWVIPASLAGLRLTRTTEQAHNFRFIDSLNVKR